MTRAAFRQADIERILRAAKAVGAVVQIDLRRLVVTIYPNMDEAKVDPLTGLAPDGPENWDDDRPIRKLPDDFAL
ncbi:hypothetical protein PMI03_03172 [Rhizobium sp. AP16]|nr:hypothetical protein PMI03_03172 [Rhizobium sp. AP16]